MAALRFGIATIFWDKEGVEDDWSVGSLMGMNYTRSSTLTQRV